MIKEIERFYADLYKEEELIPLANVYDSFLKNQDIRKVSYDDAAMCVFFIFLPVINRLKTMDSQLSSKELFGMWSETLLSAALTVRTNMGSCLILKNKQL